MMISVGGKERTLEEFQALAAAADERFQVRLPKKYFSPTSFAFVLTPRSQMKMKGVVEE